MGCVDQEEGEWPPGFLILDIRYRLTQTKKTTRLNNGEERGKSIRYEIKRQTIRLAEEPMPAKKPCHGGRVLITLVPAMCNDPLLVFVNGFSEGGGNSQLKGAQKKTVQRYPRQQKSR